MAIFTLLRAIFLATLISIIAAAQTGKLNKELKPQLSPAAEIYYPGSEGYTNATTRWSADARPGLDVIVKVGSEKDVQATIRYANAKSIPFLAIGGGHGTSSFLSGIKSGIGIYLRGLSGVSLAPGNSSQVVVQGGTLSGEAIRALWDLGKQSTTGGCDCTGFTSPMMGGGHGWLQGRYGLMLDNLVSARMVLANGTAITVDATHEPDLFWGMRGAGHNFGVVTSVHYQVYDRTPDIDGFATATFTFKQDKLEDVFAIANQWLAAPKRPVELTHYGIITNDPSVDSKPIILFLVYWQGPGPIPTQYTDPLKALSPVNLAEDRVTLLNAAGATGASFDGPACAKGLGRQTFPVDLDKWSLPNLRTILTIFSNLPSSLTHSVMLLEGFATNRVLEIPASTTAYAARTSQLLASSLFTYPANDTAAHNYVTMIGRQTRDAMLNGTSQPLHAYVNYANGDESQEAVFGYEPWRLERLRGLKRKFDPKGRFSFYEPIKV